MPVKTTLFILGAGPGGSVAALAAEKAGMQYIIAERESFPRDKVCGDGIFLSVFDFLEKTGIEKSSLLKNHFQSESVSIFNSKNEHLELKTNFLTSKRQTFDDLLWNQIPDKNKKSGIQVTSIKKAGDLFHIILEENNKTVEIISEYLIGADGYSSYVKRNFFNSLKYTVRIASRAYIRGKLNVDNYQFYFEDDILPGYFWCFKTGPDEYNTGVYPEESSKLNIKELHRFYLNKHFRIDLPAEEFKTWSIPNNLDLSQLASENALLVGDAAGLCDCLFGHGIDTAIISGHVAIKSIVYFKNNPDKFPLAEVYRYNLSQYLEESLRISKKMHDEIAANKPNTISILKAYSSQ